MTTTLDRATAALAPASSVRRPGALVAMTRPSQIALILVVLANGVLLGLWRSGVEPDLPRLLWALTLTLLSAAAVHLANEAADHRTDRLSERTPWSGGSGALRDSGWSPRLPLRLARALALVVVAAAVVGLIAGLLSATATGLLLAGLGGGLAYSLCPLSAMRHGWGEPLNAVLGALALPLFGVAVVSGTIGANDVVAFTPFFLVALASVMATAWVDRDADAATGKATLQVRLAPRRLRAIHVVVTVAFVPATLLSAALGAMPMALAALLVLPLLVVGSVRYTRVRTPVANVAAMVSLALVTVAGLGASLDFGPG